jgi:hypothetical protein
MYKGQNKKSPAHSRQGFFFVDKRVEISNLLWDMAMIIKLADYSG